MMWYLSTELSADKFVDNVNVVNYTFLSQFCGDFSAFSKRIITIIHHILVLASSLGAVTYSYHLTDFVAE